MQSDMRTVRMLFWWIVLILGVFGLAIFAAQNSQRVELQFITWTSHEMPIAYFIYMSFAAGVFFAGLVGLAEILRMASRLRKARRRQELLEREVHALRNQPLYDEPPPATVSQPNVIEERLTHDGLPERIIQGVERG